MTIARVIAGYSLGGADLLRRAMGKKKAEEMAKQKQTFLDGAIATGLATPEDADRIFELMAYFAGYGFNKSHSAAYALISYQTAYLKAHYPVEFYAALMTCDGDNTDKVVRLIGDARANGIVVRPPDVNNSRKDFSVDAGGIRFGLGAIKMVGEGAVDEIILGREEGAFRSLFELCERVDLKKMNRRTFEQLIRSGACDGFGRERYVLFHNIDRAIERAQATARDRASGQGSLFDLLGGGGANGRANPKSDAYLEGGQPWLERARLEYEKEAIGFYVSGHPLDSYKKELERYSSHTIARLQEGLFEPRQEVSIGGIVVAMRERLLKSGDGRMAFVTVEDLGGQVEVVFFAKSYGDAEPALKSGEPLLITGSARYEGDEENRTLKLRAEKAVRLSEIRRERTRKLAFRIDASRTEPRTVFQLMDVIAAHKGQVPVTFLVDLPRIGRAVIEPSGGLAVSPEDELIAAAERLLGKDAVLTV